MYIPILKSHTHTGQPYKRLSAGAQVDWSNSGVGSPCHIPALSGNSGK